MWKLQSAEKTTCHSSCKKCVQLIILMEVMALEVAYTRNRIVLLDKSLLLGLDNVRV